MSLHRTPPTALLRALEFKGDDHSFAGMQASEQAELVRHALLEGDVDLDPLTGFLEARQQAGALPYPALDDPNAAHSLLEEAILLGVDVDPAPPLDPSQPERLGWSLSMDGHLVPVHALAWQQAATTPDCPWDTKVKTAQDWLRSPNRILGLSPDLLPHVTGAHPTVYGDLPLEIRIAPIRIALKQGGARAAEKMDDLATLLDRAEEQQPDSEERLHVLLDKLGDSAPAMAQAARQSLFFGADNDLWAARLELLTPTGEAFDWALRQRDSAPRLLHRELASLLLEAAPEFKLNSSLTSWLREQSKRIDDPSGILAREALDTHRRQWFQHLPVDAQTETLRALSDLSKPLANLMWILRGATNALAKRQIPLVAQAWKKRRSGPTDNGHLALLGALAYPALTQEDRKHLAQQASASPNNWRVGVTVRIAQVASHHDDAEMVGRMATDLERCAAGGVLAVAASIGLLQLVRQDVLSPRDVWLQRIRAAIDERASTDPRVLREFDLVG